MAYKVIILYRLYMPSYFLGTFTEYPEDIIPYSSFLFRMGISRFILCSKEINVSVAVTPGIS